jgi:antitoxin YefM
LKKGIKTCTISLYNKFYNKNGVNMSIHTTYTNARAHLASFLDEVTKNQEVVIIKRRGTEDVALISASELTGLIETSHLLRSPKNAERLLAAYERAQKKEGTPLSIEELKKESGIKFE